MTLTDPRPIANNNEHHFINCIHTYNEAAFPFPQKFKVIPARYQTITFFQPKFLPSRIILYLRKMTYVHISKTTNQANISRGVSLHWLKHGFMSELKSNGKDEKSTVKDLDDLKKDSGIIRQKGQNITCPVDGNYGTSYVDRLVGQDNVGPTTILLLHSHAWKNTVGDILDTISEHCESENLDPKSMYIWIDFLCSNLNRIAELKRIKSWKPPEQFENTVGKLKSICGKAKDVKILTCMSPWHNIILLTNIWSIYEMYHYVNYADDDEIDVKFVMPHEEKKNMIRSAVFNEDGLNQLLNMVNNIGVAKINKKQRDSEEEAVLDLIRAGPGIEEVNGWVKDWVQDCLVDEICGEQKIVSMEDVDRLCSQVAPILMQSGGYNQAFRLFQKSLSIREKNEENAHRKATVCQNIGIVLQKMDELDESLTYLKKAIILLKKEHGIYHVDTADCYNSIGDVHHALDDFERSLEMYQMAQSIEEKLHGMNHSRTAKAFHNIGKVMNAAQRPDEALVYFQQALAIHEGIHGRNNVDIAETYRSIASAFTNKDEHGEAILNYKNALAIYEEIFGDTDAETAACCNSLAMAYCDRHDYELSWPYFERSIKIYEEVLGKSHPHTQVARESYEEVKAFGVF